MKLVMIEWYDSHSWGYTGWKSLKALKEDSEPLICISVGWLVDQSNGQTIIVSHIYAECEDEDEYRKATGEMIIPTCAIKEMWILEEVE